MKDTPGEKKPAKVAGMPKQAGGTPDRWSWVKRQVWTERMLATLVTGVKGGKWFSLVDKVYARKNLEASWEVVKARKGAGGIDGQSIHEFEKRKEAELAKLEAQLREGTYEPRPVKRVFIPKPGSHEKRPLGIPAVRDRVVQTALRDVLEPIFERKFAQHSYGFRPQRGCKDALRRVQQLLDEGYRWVVEADIQKYFDTIPHEGMMKEVEKEVADGRVLELLWKYLEQGVMEEGKEWVPDEGTPQGAVISPLLANIYLHPVDVVMEGAGYQMVRYADDFIVLCRSREEALRALDKVRKLMDERGLALHPDKTRVVDASQSGGFDFLGYHFEQGRRWPSGKSLDKFRNKIRAKTRRTNGNSLAYVIADVNRVVRGWFEYFKHSYHTTFPYLDGWVRMRLRSILRKRAGRRGRGRGRDNQRWTNAYFKAAGLFTMTEARAALCRSR